MASTGQDRKTLLQLYAQMLEIRIFEEFVVNLVNQRKIACPTHLCIGQEAISAGVCAALERRDLVWGTHRSHGPFLGKVREFDGLMAELLTRDSGVSQGYGGSMHLTSRKHGFMASTAIVAGTLPLAVGGGLALHRTKQKAISVAFFGDGAMDEGVFYECLNLAAVYRLPVLFVCENNLYSTHRRLEHRQAQTDLSMKAQAFGLKTVRVDGNDAVAVHRVAAQARKRILAAREPMFLEFMTYRWLSHVGAEPDVDFDFRTRAEVHHWIRRCPVKRMERLLQRKKILNATQAATMRSEMLARVEASYRKVAS